MGDPANLHDQIRAAFFPEAARRIEAFKASGNRLAHYTSADAAIQIVFSEQIWLRKAAVMNDFREARHGADCLAAAWRSEAGLSFKGWLNGIFPSVTDRIEEEYNSHYHSLINDTYIVSFSEHPPEEDEYGRLSMWRAYGGPAGVGLILNPSVFMSQSDVLKAYSAPVIYADERAFQTAFAAWVEGVRRAEGLVQQLGPDGVAALILMVFRIFVLCSKHPGFREEREWRVFHTPTIDVGGPLARAVETIRGVPQPVIKIPLRNHPEGGLVGAAIPELLDRVLIGPTATPLVIYDAFCDALGASGVENPGSRIFASQIPLRLQT
jgi:hypothetical protein